MMFHLTVRVAWHDSKWNGTVCKDPANNCYCVALDRVRESRIDEDEIKLAGKQWKDISPSALPPCKAESGVFMNPCEWIREFIHPYASMEICNKTHGDILPTKMNVPEYSAFAIPYGWLLRSEQKRIDEKLTAPLPQDEKAPFSTAWVFGRERQNSLLDLFFGRLKPEKSLVFFYCKEGQPLGDTISRLVVGVGEISSIAPPKYFDVNGKKKSYQMWDRSFRHTIRPDGEEGFLLPYHEYLEPTGNPEEDIRRQDLMKEIAVQADSAHMRVFSYAAELAPNDIALSTLVRLLESVRKIRSHGVAKGPWERREEWLNKQIAAVWKDRGAFPGFGSVLEALGMRLGTALSLEMIATDMVASDSDPWPVFNDLIRGKISPPQPAYTPDIAAIHDSWINLSEERRNILVLLSRFALTPAQAMRWFDQRKRSEGTAVNITDAEIIANPYRMSEVDLGDKNDSPVSVGMIDRGLLPEANLAEKHPVRIPLPVSSTNDPRRIRGVIVEVLREASKNGDSLLSITETLNSVTKLSLAHPCVIGTDWPITNKSSMENVVEIVNIGIETDKNKIAALQLSEFKKREDKLRSILDKRACKSLMIIKENWAKLLIDAITEAGGKYDSLNSRHTSAISEQSTALDIICSRRLSCLTGRAGTGKTSVMGAIMLCAPIASEGILFLAPTGKARVRLGKATNAEAMTVAQFLNRLNRYDTERQRPLFEGQEKYRKEKTVVIDECSMLTMDDLMAVLEALDLAHVQRIILVGDPNQLPPIGVGRPFADLVAYLENTDKVAADGETLLSGAIARLTVEVRTAANSNDVSDALRLASWFSRDPQPVDADRVLSDLEDNKSFNDLEIRFWKNTEELHHEISESFIKHLGLLNKEDISGFNTSLGLDERGWVPFESPEGSEQWQILSPVRMHTHGIYEINRWIQHQYRSKELKDATNHRGISLGDQNIVIKDKVIQTVNEWRDAFDGATNKYYLANGEVGLVANSKSGFLNILFAGRPNLRFGYNKNNFVGGTGPLELAYALTVHKAQGSEFKKVFVILPKNCRLLSRELIYTALTRSRKQLVLLVEGDNASVLYDFTRPEKSETARRNTNLFNGVVRLGDVDVPYAEHLIHKTEKGHLVRSKSELVIANILYQNDVKYEYERLYEGSVDAKHLRPDFSFVTADGDLIIWEHLGMMDRDDYRRGWEWKYQWYKNNGFIEGETLFTSEDNNRDGLDSTTLKQIALKIKSLIE